MEADKQLVALSSEFVMLEPNSQVVLAVKNLPANAGDSRVMGSILKLGRSPGEGNGNQLQHSCLENSMDREAW